MLPDRSCMMKIPTGSYLMICSGFRVTPHPVVEPSESPPRPVTMKPSPPTPVPPPAVVEPPAPGPAAPPTPPLLEPPLPENGDSLAEPSLGAHPPATGNASAAMMKEVLVDLCIGVPTSRVEINQPHWP